MLYEFKIYTASFDHHSAQKTTKPSKPFLLFKRAFDITASFILMPVLAIVCVITYIFNPFFNRGSLFYKQERVGKNNKVFRIYKLRSMQDRSEGQALIITPMGQFMRDTHIDELPQIINVLRGDMSLIGPRPEQPQIYSDYAKSIQNFTIRQSVRPGISGLAQLCYGYTDCPIGAREKLKWDLQYIDHQGFGMDCHICIQTFTYVFPRIGNRLIALAMLKGGT